MLKDNKNKIVLFLGILIFIAFIIISFVVKVREYTPDSIIFIAIIILLFLARKKINLHPITFSLIIISLIAHNSGVFGWYNTSPFFIQYDHLTHFIGFFAVSIALFQLMEKYFTKSKLTNFILILVVLMASLGIGAILEQTEYLGFVRLGTGPGFLKFGGLGDTFSEEENLRAFDIIGGGWINAMLDLNYNFLGALTGIILMYFINRFKR